ncbi:MAG: hypothetical protein KDA96_15405, partial [Planctomycetaceae bacterium]|nr:hypothetical protein [Planctomycetaceae bacterium]
MLVVNASHLTLRASLLLVLGITVIMIPGCGGSSDSTSTAASDDLLNEILDGTGETVDSPTAGSSSEGDVVPARTASQSSGGVPLHRRLQPGMRIPVMKTIEQTLVQKSEQYPATARTQLDLWMLLTVEAERSGQSSIRVSFQRVRYRHDLNGNRVVYDSDSGQEIPWDALPYAGLVSHSYLLVLGPDNEIADLPDYEAFVIDSTSGIPVERRSVLPSEIANRFGNDNIADIVQDTFHLLPYNKDVDAEH